MVSICLLLNLVLAFPNDALNGVNKDSLIKFAKLVQAENFKPWFGKSFKISQLTRGIK